MTELLQKAIDRVRALPKDEQDRVARLMLNTTETVHKANGETKAPEWGPLWRDLTPAERVADFKKWMDSITDGPGLPDEALRRENIYD